MKKLVFLVMGLLAVNILTAQNANGKLTQKTDAIEYMFQEAVRAYIDGERTKERALANFKQQAAESLNR